MDNESEGRRGSAADGADRRRILVVDDSQDSAESLALLLELHGHEVRTAFAGPAALEAASTFLPEIVLLDIGLPGMDGYEVARRLRVEHDGCRLIALTGYGREDDRERSREAGFDHHLVKPVDLAELTRVLG
jgi:DNA-binding response OmpR family regulator